MTVEEKLYLGQQLERLGVDILEAGFPRTSPGDFRAVQLLAEKLRDVQICALSGFKPDQVEAAWAQLKRVKRLASTSSSRPAIFTWSVNCA